MSDFGELCPLFHTGVYHEVTFPNIRTVSGVSATGNLLEGTVCAGLGTVSGWSFGRTVVITGAFLKRWGTNHTAENVYLGHRTSTGADATAFGTATVTTTLSVYNEWTWQAMTVSTSKTFASAEILNLSFGTVTETHNGDYCLMVRFRDK